MEKGHWPTLIKGKEGIVAKSMPLPRPQPKNFHNDVRRSVTDYAQTQGY